MVAGGNVLKGLGIGGGSALTIGSGGTLAVAGVALGSMAVVAGEALEVGGAVTITLGLSMIGTNKNAENSYREKKRGANSNDKQQIDSIAKEAKIDRRKFGDFIESTKKLEGRGPSDNYTYKELKELANQFKELQ